MQFRSFGFAVPTPPGATACGVEEMNAYDPGVGQPGQTSFATDHGRLKHRPRPMRGLRTERTTQVIIAGLALMQNLRRGHYELGIDGPRGVRVVAAFTELALAI